MTYSMKVERTLTALHSGSLPVVEAILRVKMSGRVLYWGFGSGLGVFQELEAGRSSEMSLCALPQLPRQNSNLSCMQILWLNSFANSCVTGAGDDQYECRIWSRRRARSAQLAQLIPTT